MKSAIFWLFEGRSCFGKVKWVAFLFAPLCDRFPFSCFVLKTAFKILSTCDLSAFFIVAIFSKFVNFIPFLSLCRAFSWVLLEFMMTPSVRSSISLLFLPFPKY